MEKYFTTFEREGIVNALVIASLKVLADLKEIVAVKDSLEKRIYVSLMSDQLNNMLRVMKKLMMFDTIEKVEAEKKIILDSLK